MFERPEGANILVARGNFNGERIGEEIFMKRLFRAGAAIAIAACVCAAAPALAVEPGRAAPSFELRLMEGGDAVRSDGLFPRHEQTFLVFWRSSCPHCVESLLGCERFYRLYGGEDITVLGINTDDGDRLAVRGTIESNRITFPQALDAGGMAASSYGIPFEAFALILVDREGIVRGIRFDPEGDAGAAMEEMLREGSVAAAESAEAPGASGEPVQAAVPAAPARGIAFSYHGLQRIRLLAVDAQGDDATGLYGEPASTQRGVQYRLEVEGSLRLAKSLRAGGLLRISNEGEEVLASGPEYLGSEWGSAFAEVEAGGFIGRLGYYDIFMTPLTLMRWDWDDNPRIGGDAGCGCGGAAAGVLLLESLEELGPVLTFEGAHATYSAADFEARVFYAIPRRELETDYGAYRYGGEERAQYSQEIAGAELRWQRLDERTGSFWRAAAHAIASFENKNSVDFVGLGYYAADPWIQTRTLSFTAEAPIVRYARLRGEIIAWNDTKEKGILNQSLEYVDEFHRGSGGFGGIVIEKPLGPAVLVDYLRLSRGYATPYAALSYEENTEGLRTSARVPLFDDRVSIDLFYKRLREADLAPSETDRAQISLAGASLDLVLRGGFGAELGWLESKRWRDGTGSPLDERRRGIVAELRREFEKIGALRLRYERVDNDAITSSGEAESKTDMYSLYSSIEF